MYYSILFNQLRIVIVNVLSNHATIPCEQINDTVYYHNVWYYIILSFTIVTSSDTSQRSSAPSAIIAVTQVSDHGVGDIMCVCTFCSVIRSS